MSIKYKYSTYVCWHKTDLASKTGAKRVVVAHAGFEPAISSLRGRCPKPLDECAFFVLLSISR